MGGGALKDNLLIILPGKEPTKAIEHLKKKFPGLNVTFFSVAANLDFENLKTVPVEIYKDATILVTFASLPPKPEDAPNLDWIQFFSAGTDRVVKHPIYKDTDITLTTAYARHPPHCNSNAYMHTVQVSTALKYQNGSLERPWHIAIICTLCMNGRKRANGVTRTADFQSTTWLVNDWVSWVTAASGDKVRKAKNPKLRGR
jgi:hypothetical protein